MTIPPELLALREPYTTPLRILVQGDTLLLPFSYYTAAGDPIDLTGLHVEATLHYPDSSTETPISLTATIDTNTIEVEISAATSADIDLDELTQTATGSRLYAGMRWELELSDDDTSPTQRKTLERGPVTVEAD